MGMYQEQISDLKTVYFGGGTPSLMDPLQLEDIMKSIQKFGIIKDDSEITMEIDPGTFDSAKLNNYRDLGVTRLSMGIQTLNENEFKLLGRGHQFKDIMESVNQIKKSHFKDSQITVDLIMGIPNQSVKSYESNLDKTMALNFGHQSFYLLTLEENTPFYRQYQYNKQPLPVEDSVVQMYALTHDKLTLNGFTHYEVSNYARQESLVSNHNNMYWEGDTEYLGFGCGAASYLKGRRFTRPKTLTKYYQFVDTISENRKYIDQLITQETEYEKAQNIIMCQMRRQNGLQMDKIKPYLKDPDSDIPEIITDIQNKYKDLKSKYFSQVSTQQLSLQPIEGFLLSNTLISDIQLIFDKYLKTTEYDVINQNL